MNVMYIWSSVNVSRVFQSYPCFQFVSKRFQANRTVGTVSYQVFLFHLFYRAQISDLSQLYATLNKWLSDIFGARNTSRFRVKKLHPMIIRHLRTHDIPMQGFLPPEKLKLPPFTSKYEAIYLLCRLKMPALCVSSS